MQMMFLMNSLSHFVQDIKKILEISMRGSNLIFDLVQVMYYKCQKINCSLGGSYIESPDWIKKKKSNKKSEYR